MAIHLENLEKSEFHIGLGKVKELGKVREILVFLWYASAVVVVTK